MWCWGLSPELCVGGVPMHAYYDMHVGVKRQVFKCQCSFILWVLGIELKSLGTGESAFTYPSILLDSLLFFLREVYTVHLQFRGKNYEYDKNNPVYVCFIYFSLPTSITSLRLNFYLKGIFSKEFLISNLAHSLTELQAWQLCMR